MESPTSTSHRLPWIISASEHTARRAACVKLARLQLKQAVQLLLGLVFLVDTDTVRKY